LNSIDGTEGKEESKAESKQLVESIAGTTRDNSQSGGESYKGKQQIQNTKLE